MCHQLFNICLPLLLLALWPNLLRGQLYFQTMMLRLVASASSWTPSEPSWTLVRWFTESFFWVFVFFAIFFYFLSLIYLFCLYLYFLSLSFCLPFCLCLFCFIFFNYHGIITFSIFHCIIYFRYIFQIFIDIFKLTIYFIIF